MITLTTISWPMTWKTCVVGIVMAGWLVWGCTETPHAKDLDQLLDVDLAQQMSHKCYDVRVAVTGSHY